ncbi:hypothetical protein [Paenibacillus sp. GCM10012306]|uniref:hypothetical protein n=1 Tax=Paenibacillus sp. GCM10012306 TaxID=3317342 RepID=UPI003611D3B6
MRRKKAFIILVTGSLALLVVFIYLTPFVGNLVANTRLEGYARSVGIRIIKKSPPLPSVISDQTQIPVIQSSYCWGSVCADYEGGITMLRGVAPTAITPDRDIKVSFAYKPAPNGLYIEQFIDNTTIQIPLNNDSFNAPKEQGTYYYGISAVWTTEDGKFSKGSTSAGFVIEVK